MYVMLKIQKEPGHVAGSSRQGWAGGSWEAGLLGRLRLHLEPLPKPAVAPFPRGQRQRELALAAAAAHAGPLVWR